MFFRSINDSDFYCKDAMAPVIDDKGVAQHFVEGSFPSENLGLIRSCVRRRSQSRFVTSLWSNDKCVRCSVLVGGEFNSWPTLGRVLLQSLVQDLANWYCSLLTRRMVCGRAAESTLRTQKQTEWNETRICTNTVVALQDHCSHKTPTKHHIKKMSFCRVWFGDDFENDLLGLLWDYQRKSDS